ncbi:MAG: hypothetical protein AB1529_07000 [Candidatus Micrarchaeota archaeon]
MVTEILSSKKSRVLIPLLCGGCDRKSLMEFFYGRKKMDYYTMKSKSGKFNRGVLEALREAGLVKESKGMLRTKKTGGKARKAKRDRRITVAEADLARILDLWFPWALAHKEGRHRGYANVKEDIEKLHGRIFDWKKMSPLFTYHQFKYDIKDGKFINETWAPVGPIDVSVFGFIGMCLVFSQIGGRDVTVPYSELRDDLDKNLLSLVKQALWRRIKEQYPDTNYNNFGDFFDEFSAKVMKNYEEEFGLKIRNTSDVSGISIRHSLYLFFMDFSYWAIETRKKRLLASYDILTKGVGVKANLKNLHETLQKEIVELEKRKRPYQREERWAGRPILFTDSAAFKKDYGYYPDERQVHFFVGADSFLELYPAFEDMIRKFM